MTSFDSDTQITRLAAGSHQVTFNKRWWIVAGPNGGLLAAQFLAAARAEVEDRPVRTMTVHYLSAATVGDAVITTVVERLGRGVAFLTQRMEQDGRLIAITQVAMAGSREVADNWNELDAPDVAPPEMCPTLVTAETSPAFRSVWDSRWTTGVPGRASPIAKANQTAVGGWTRLSEDQPLDQRILAAMADSWIPPLFTNVSSAYAAPTLELTIHFRTDLSAADTSPGAWCHAAFFSPVAAGGYVDESGEIWSADGELLVQSRQLSLMAAMPEGHEPMPFNFSDS